MSIILNRPIVILEDIYYNEKKFYKKLASFNNIDFNSLLIDGIIFINFQNNNHYELLLPNKNFIKNRINKITIPEIKQLIIVNVNNTQSNTNFINVYNKIDDYKKRNKKKINDKEPSSKDKINQNNDNTNISAINKEEDNDEESNIIEKEKIRFDNFKISSKGKNLIFDINLYNNTLQKYEFFTKTRTDEKRNLIKNIPQYPILIGKKINENYYADIYRYLYVYNNELKISRYSNKIINIKKISTRDNKKRDFRKKYSLFIWTKIMFYIKKF